MKRLRKVLLTILIMVVGITASTVSQAFDVYRETAQGIIQDNKFYPNTNLPGGTFFCIEPGGEFHVLELMTEAENTSYPAGYLIPQSGDYLCEHGNCSPDLEDQLPWENDTKYFYRYTQGQTFSWSQYPDAAYVLAEMTERGSLISWETAYGIWNSRLSNPQRIGDYQIVGESQAYKTFYETIHGGLTTNDIFETLISDNTGNVKIGVNQSEGSYTVGPFNIDYPDGVYDGENKFSWIESVEAVTNAGTLPVEILLSSGQSVSITDLGEKGSQTLDQKDFYIKFYSTEATQVSLKVEFGYLEHCDATMTEYTGTRVYRDWQRQTNGTHEHKTWVSDWDGQEDHNGDGVVNDDDDYGHDEKYYVTKRRYQAYDRTDSDSQKLMALSGDASKVRKKVVKYFPGGAGIDLTMRLEGDVFLDQDRGKVNEGNNKKDGDEGLPGIEVYLHQVGGGVVAQTLTDGNGHYAFANLNSQKDYYVEFVYNGMLYTNVARLEGNADDISKATEEAQGHGGNRQAFNDQFKEIGSFPQNYKGRRVYLQEEIADTFKEIAKNFGAHGNDEKSLFAADCRISAYTTNTYPLIDVFTIDYSWNNIAGQSYNPIYSGAYNQLHVNLGIKARPTFDLALYKDVFNAKLNINGQEEVYTYDARKDWENNGFSYGVREDYYLNELRNKYIHGTDTNITTTEVASEGEYSHEYRTEEIVNGNNQNEAINESVLYDSDKQYAWRDINHGITDDTDKLHIHVTYKLAIRNQSTVIGAITELVDYYDSHYQFEEAYVGDKNGSKTGDVVASTTSMYGDSTLTSTKEGTWKVGIDKAPSGYKTIYLRPVDETKLYQDHQDHTEQYIYVTFGLIDPENTLIEAGLPAGNRFYTYNMAEINGYKTYGTFEQGPDVTASLGLVDRDSNPGNFNPSTYVFGETALEDDESRAPAYAYSIRTSRTLEGNVFEDALSKDATASKDKYVVNVAKTRFGNGTIDSSDKKIEGVKVELVEIKNGQLVVRQTTYTDKDGWYGFGAFLPGDYTIRFTYGAEDKTALTTTSQYTQGLNATSYNGQDYQSTKFTIATTQEQGTLLTCDYKSYGIDEKLKEKYNDDIEKGRSNGETKIITPENMLIYKYTKTQTQEDGQQKEIPYYWFDDPYMANKSDAEDDVARRTQVVAYSKTEYGKEITNHKAEVFNSYINQKTLREQESKDDKFDEFTQAQPMEEVVDTEAKNRELVNELERRTYMYAYTPEIKVEVEYTTKQIEGNMNAKKAADDKKDYYEYKITGVDFGVTERPREQLTIDQDVKHIKVTAADGTTLLELDNDNGEIKVRVDNGNNYQWLRAGKVNELDDEELINLIFDDELLSGAKLEVTYNITVTNNSEANTGTTRAKTIINYVANNLNFDLADNNGLWEVVKKEDIQTTSHSTFINNASRNKDVKLVDLSTQTTVLKATNANPLTKVLNPGESTTSTLTLKKTLSAESSVDDLSYSNMSEIVEIDNTVGRYDHGAIPGNQSLEEQPREHDTSGASRYDEIDQDAGTKNVKTRYPQDGKIIVTPPTGSKMIYYVLGITLTLILATGIILIKKFVIRKK